MRVPALLLPHIETALGLQLTDKQKLFLCKGGFSLKPEEGRTLMHCVRLSLIEGSPLDITKPESFSDRLDWRYSRRDFLPIFLDTHSKLQKAGLEVRQLTKNSEVKSYA